MMRTVRCSIIIPTRNCLAYLRKAIRSVEMQERSDIEIIVVDDGSTDGTGEWLEAAALLNPQIRVLRTGGVGPSVTRNIAIEHAAGLFIAFLDADDWWWPNKLDKQLAFHEANPDVAFSFTDYLHIDPDGGHYNSCFEFWTPHFISGHGRDFVMLPDAVNELLACNCVGTSTVVASRIALQNAKGFANRYSSAEDWDLWLRLAATGPVAYSTAIMTSYLMRPNSQTQNKPERIASMEATVERYSDHVDAKRNAALRQARRRISIARGEMARDKREYLSAASHHLSAFLASPTTRDARALVSDLARAVTELGRSDAIRH